MESMLRSLRMFYCRAEEVKWKRAVWGAELREAKSPMCGCEGIVHMVRKALAEQPWKKPSGSSRLGKLQLPKGSEQ